jgi:hypothetical protein
MKVEVDEMGLFVAPENAEEEASLRALLGRALASCGINKFQVGLHSGLPRQLGRSVEGGVELGEVKGTEIGAGFKGLQFRLWFDPPK